MARIIDAVIVRSPAQRIAEWRTRNELAILAYHGIDDPVQFGEQMAYLGRHKHPVRVEDVVRAVLGECVLPRDAVLVTFDDGDRTVLEYAAPILKSYGIPAALFVITGLLDSDTPFWWDEVFALVSGGGRCEAFSNSTSPADAVRHLKRVSDDRRREALRSLRRTASAPGPRKEQLKRAELRELEADGITIGNHTHSHPCLHQCTLPKIRDELEVAQEILTDVLGHRPDVLAYPNGDQDPRVRAAAAASGFAAAFLFDHRTTVLPVSDPLRVSRLRVSSTTSMDRFKIILSGLHPSLHRSLGRK